MVCGTRFGLCFVLVITACASAERTGSAPTGGEATTANAIDARAFELSAGIVVAPSMGSVFVARPGGGIEALDSTSGQPLWSSDEAARPLLAHGGRLLAQRETGSGLPLAVLEAADGAALQRFEVPLPEGARAAIDESPEARFTLSPRAAGGDVILEWEYLERDALGVSPPGGRPFARRELGVLRVDLASGEATLVDPGALPSADGELPPQVERLVAAGELRARPWRTDDLLVAAQQIYEPAGDRLVLRRWRAHTGEALPEVSLSAGRPVAVLPAADRRHLLVVTPLETALGERHRYRWTIHSLATGTAVAERRAERSASPFCIVRGMLLYLELPSGRRIEDRWEEMPLRLRALDPTSGDELWHRAVRDPAFYGPAPPRP